MRKFCHYNVKATFDSDNKLLLNSHMQSWTSTTALIYLYQPNWGNFQETRREGRGAGHHQCILSAGRPRERGQAPLQVALLCPRTDQGRGSPEEWMVSSPYRADFCLCVLDNKDLEPLNSCTLIIRTSH